MLFMNSDVLYQNQGCYRDEDLKTVAVMFVWNILGKRVHFTHPVRRRPKVWVLFMSLLLAVPHLSTGLPTVLAPRRHPCSFFWKACVCY